MKTEEQRLLDELYDRENRVLRDEEFLLDSKSSFKHPTKPVNYPDAKKHQVISFIKSGIRVLSCFVGLIGFYELGFFGLLVAEIVGIYEELV